MNPLCIGQGPLVVGSIANLSILRELRLAEAGAACDVIEIRLDRISACADAAPWAHLRGFPLMFTARRAEEGGSGDLSAGERAGLLQNAIGDAAVVDVEVASIDEMAGLLEQLAARGIPWVASFHDFRGPSNPATLAAARDRAAAAGAAVFKAAVTLHDVPDLIPLAEFQRAPAPLPVAAMGMGPLGQASRLLCAQLGSALNYGFLGQTPTAPGQWSAAMLREAIARLAPLRDTP